MGETVAMCYMYVLLVGSCIYDAINPVSASAVQRSEYELDKVTKSVMSVIVVCVTVVFTLAICMLVVLRCKRSKPSVSASCSYDSVPPGAATTARAGGEQAVELDSTLCSTHHYHFREASFNNCQFGNSNAMTSADDVDNDVDADDSRSSTDTDRFTVTTESQLKQARMLPRLVPTLVRPSV